MFVLLQMLRGTCRFELTDLLTVCAGYSSGE